MQADEELLNQINYRQEYGNYLTRIQSGSNPYQFTARCPFHEDMHNSFSFNIQTGLFNCFACNTKGNYINFYAKLNNISTKESYKRIMKSFGIKVTAEGNIAENYSVETYAREKNLDLNYLVNDWGLSTFRDKIVIPYKDEEGEIVSIRYRGKDKKFTWKTGDKTNVYGLDKLNTMDKDYIIIVEGESDTQTLSYFKYPVIGIPGANNFKQEYTKYLNEFKEVLIHNEQDIGGKQFVKNIVETLKKDKYKGKVYEISCMTFNCKDFNELYISNEMFFEGTITTLLINKNEINIYSKLQQEIIIGSGIYADNPDRYIASLEGVIQIDSNDNKTLITRTPLLIRNILKDEDIDEIRYIITFYKDDRWNDKIILPSILFSSSKIIELADIGIHISSENAKSTVRYLSDYLATNINNIKTLKIVSNLGWYNDNFVPYASKDIILNAEGCNILKKQAIKKVGNRQIWLKMIKHLRENKVFRFVFSAGLASLIIEKINVRSFLIYLHSESRSGKTACINSMLSSFGDPKELITTFYSTKVGLEQIAMFFNNFPLAIDEKQILGDDQKFLATVPYMLVSGESKARGNKTGGLQKHSSWNNISILTGEELYTNSSSKTGLHTRMLEIAEKPFNNEEEAKDTYQILSSNYGHIGEEYIKKMIQEYSGKWNVLSEEVRNIEKRFKEGSVDNLSSHITAVSSVVAVDTLISKWFFNDNLNDESFNMGEAILKGLVKEGETDIIEKAYEFVNGWISANAKCFGKDKNVYQRYGEVKDNKCYIFKYILDNALKSNNYNEDTIMSGFAKKGYIDKDKNGKNTIVRKVDGNSVRMVSFNMVT